MTVTARDGGGAVALDVADEGVLPPGGSLVPSQVEEATTPPGGHRLGLRMAASLAEGVGGRLVHAHTESDDPDDPAARRPRRGGTRSQIDRCILAVRLPSTGLPLAGRFLASRCDT